MDAKNIIRQLIREELKKALHEAISRSTETQLDEAKFAAGQKPHNAGKSTSERPKGAGKTKGPRGGKYKSAGTLPSSMKPGKNGKLDKSGRVAKRKVDSGIRDTIGKKLLNAYARGDKGGTGKQKGQKAGGSASFRTTVKKKAEKEFGNTDRKSINSVIWAIASVKAAHSGAKKAKGAATTPAKKTKGSTPKAPPTGNQP